MAEITYLKHVVMWLAAHEAQRGGQPAKRLKTLSDAMSHELADELGSDEQLLARVQVRLDGFMADALALATARKPGQTG